MHTGIDLGLNVTAVVSLDDNGKVLHKAHFGSVHNDPFKHAIKAPEAERFTLYYHKLMDYLVTNNITGTVVMEQPMGALVGNGKKILTLQGAYLVVLGQLFNTNKVFQPKATAIKKAFTGNGTASKEDMIEECKKRGIYPQHHHEADAVGMAFMSIEGSL